MMKVQAEAQLKAQEQAQQQKLEEQKAAYEQRLEQQNQMHEQRIANFEAAKKEDFERWKVEQDNNTKIRVAELGADAKTEAALSKGDETGKRAGDKPKGKSAIDKLGDMHSSQMQAMMQAIQQIANMVGQLAQMMDQQARPTNIEITRPDGTKIKAVASKGMH